MRLRHQAQPLLKCIRKRQHLYDDAAHHVPWLRLPIQCLRGARQAASVMKASEQQVDDIEEAFAGALGGAAAWASPQPRPPPVRIPCDSPRAALSPVPAPQPTSGRFGDVVVQQRF